MSGIFTIKGHNLFGNVAAGGCLLTLGFARFAPETSPLALACAVALLCLAAPSLFVCFSTRREHSDEMAFAHDGIASSHALKLTLILVGLACIAGTLLDAKVDLGAAGCLVVGFGLLTYGICFAALESGDGYADYENA